MRIHTMVQLGLAMAVLTILLHAQLKTYGDASTLNAGIYIEVGELDCGYEIRGITGWFCIGR